MKTLPYILLLVLLPSMASTSSFAPLSAETLYIAKRQFDVEPSALSGVWRYTPHGMKFDVESAARFIQTSNRPLTILEIGKTTLDRRNYILALVEDAAGQKLFVLFNPQGRLSYKTASYNPARIEIPENGAAGPSLKTACQSIEAEARKTGGEVRYYEGQVYDQGNIYDGCEVSLIYDPETTSHPFDLRPGGELIKKGWIDYNKRDADGGGVSYSAIENGNIFCNIRIEYAEKSETARAECFDKNKKLNQPYK